MDKIDELKKIKSLLDEGLISQIEFESLKSDIISDNVSKTDTIDKTETPYITQKNNSLIIGVLLTIFLLVGCAWFILNNGSNKNQKFIPDATVNSIETKNQKDVEMIPMDSGYNDESQTSNTINSTELDGLNNVSTEGLVGWWPFNNNANDSSIDRNNGSVVGATITADRFGNLNSAYSFNGINSYINMPSGNQTSINVTSDFTLGFWFKTSQSGSGLIGFGDNTYGNGGYLVAIGNGNLPNGTNKLSVYTGNTWYGGNVVLTDNHWHFACVTLKGSNLKIIIDNILDISIDNANAPSTFNGLRAFGARNNGSGGFFNGIVDDIGLWNRALTQNEITNLYRATPSNEKPDNINHQSNSSEYQIGKKHLGGTIISLNKTNQHGIICSDAIFTERENTLEIAKQKSKEYSTENSNNWRLPSKSEFKLIIKLERYINLNNETYWLSNEDSERGLVYTNEMGFIGCTKDWKSSALIFVKDF